MAYALISGIRASSRGARGLHRWDITVELPAIVCRADAQEIAVVAAAEAIDAIRTLWSSGRDVSGRARSVRDIGRAHRLAHRGVLQGRDYQEIRADLARYGSGRNYPRDAMPSAERYRSWRRWVHRHYVLRRGSYEPDPDASAIVSSGAILTALSARARRARVVRLDDGAPYCTACDIRLTVARDRWAQAKRVGGLGRGPRLDPSITQCPQAGRVLDAWVDTRRSLESTRASVMEAWRRENEIDRVADVGRQALRGGMMAVRILTMVARLLAR